MYCPRAYLEILGTMVSNGGYTASSQYDVEHLEEVKRYNAYILC